MHYKIVLIGYGVSSKDLRNQKPNGLLLPDFKIDFFLNLDFAFFILIKCFDYLLKLIIFAS